MKTESFPIDEKKAGVWSAKTLIGIVIAALGLQTAIVGSVVGHLGQRFLDQNERLTVKVVTMGEQQARFEERTGGLLKDVERIDGRVTRLEDRIRP